MPDQLARANRFRDLHARPEPLLLPNPWDAGSAKLLASLGFEALATTSLGAGCTAGTTAVTPELILRNCREICAATDLPVNADLENGFADDPEDAAKIYALACDAGAVGGSIEDATGDRDKPLYDFEHATKRVAAAVEAARSLPFPFVLTARTENFIRGNPDLADTIRRLQAFQKVGADVLFAPGLPDLDAVRAVCAAVSKPVNFMVGIPGRSFSMAELEAAGVRRISLATSLYWAAMTGLLDAAREVATRGTFDYVGRNMTKDLSRYMQK